MTAPMILSDMGRAAVELCRVDLPVFPCGRDKRPLTPHGFKDATRDPAEAARLWMASPAAMIGVPTGQASGLYVVDLDTTPDGPTGERTLAAMGLADLLDGPGAVTMSGGRHLYFRHPGDDFRNTAKKIGPGVDTRGDGGYVIMPPSIGEAGQYRLTGPVDWRSLPELPEALRALLRSPALSERSMPAPRIDTGPAAWCDTGLAEVAELLGYIDPDAGGYQAWCGVLMALHDHTGASPAGLALAEDWSARGAKYRPGEVRRKWAGFRSGGVTIATVAAMAGRNGADLSAIARRHKSGGNMDFHAAAPGHDPNEEIELGPHLNYQPIPPLPPRQPGPAPHVARQPRPAAPRPAVSTARDLQRRSFPPIKWVVPGLLPEGLTILMGAPKLGKSWLTLDIALAVARGGNALGQDCEQGDVLLLALEDNERRLQDRLAKIAGEGDWPEALAYSTEWGRLDKGGLAALEAWIDAAPNPRLIVIDTLGMVKPQATGKGNAYDQDIAALRPLHQLASARRVSIVVVTHKRKMEADDPLEGISGTNGLTGTADTTIALIRGPAGDGCILYGRGRDLAEFERAVTLVDCRWQVEGEPLEAFAGQTWKAILKAVRDGASKAKDIANVTGMTEGNVRQSLGRMVAKGVLTKTARGTYTYPLSQPSHCHNGAGECDGCDTCDTMRGGE